LDVSVNRFSQLSFRRLAFYALILLAVIMVGAVGTVLMMDDPLLAEEDAFPNTVIVNRDKRPDIVFPESVRTPDLSLNRFVDRFARICMQAKYADLRLMLSSRGGDPLVARRFESMFNALKQVRIIALEKMPSVPDVEGPVYLMRAEYVLEDFAVTKAGKTEQVKLAIAKEEGNWRIGPIPRSVLAQLEAYRASTSQPGSEGDPSTGVDGNTANTDTSKAGANRPISIGS
jgi:hypothetical protein